MFNKWRFSQITDTLAVTWDMFRIIDKLAVVWVSCLWNGRYRKRYFCSFRFTRNWLNMLVRFRFVWFVFICFDSFQMNQTNRTIITIFKSQCLLNSFYSQIFIRFDSFHSFDSKCLFKYIRLIHLIRLNTFILSHKNEIYTCLGLTVRCL